MKKRFLITGSNGLLGQKLINALVANDDVELIATSRGINRARLKSGYEYVPMDITEPHEVREVIHKYKPEVVIHTAAMTQVDDCESHPTKCHLMNVDAVRFLALACHDVGAHLVHVSTDFIFDGSYGPLTEEAKPNPLSVYGRSKWESEEIVKKIMKSWTILRTVLVYGLADEMSRSNIVLWAKDSLEKGKDIRVVSDQWRTPTLAEDLAQGCILAGLQKAQGVYNISGEELLSISDFVYRIAEFWKLDTSTITEINTNSLGQPAKRPPRTGFIIDKAKEELDFQPHTLEEGFQLIESQLAVRK
jgi:dTDP-4-dehydrorhamnose reductase